MNQKPNYSSRYLLMLLMTMACFGAYVGAVNHMFDKRAFGQIEVEIGPPVPVLVPASTGTDNGPALIQMAKEHLIIPPGRYYVSSTITLPTGYWLRGSGKAQVEHADGFYDTWSSDPNRYATVLIWNGTDHADSELVQVEGSLVRVEDLTLQAKALANPPDSTTRALGACMTFVDTTTQLTQSQNNVTRVSFFHGDRGVHFIDGTNLNGDQATFQSCIWHRCTFPYTCDENQSLEHSFIDCTAKAISETHASTTYDGCLMRIRQGGRHWGNWTLQDSQDYLFQVNYDGGSPSVATSNAGYVKFFLIFDAAGTTDKIWREMDYASPNANADWIADITGYAASSHGWGSDPLVETPNRPARESQINITIKRQEGDKVWPAP